MRPKLSSGCDFVLVFQALTGAASVTFFANAPPRCTSHAGKGIFPDPGQNKTIPVLWEVEVESVLGTIRQEYKRALERSNPVYRPHVPDRKKIRKVFQVRKLKNKLWSKRVPDFCLSFALCCPP